MPEKAYEKIKNNILPQWKVCFFASVIVGLIAHLYKITGWLPNWDSLVFRYDAQNMLSLGRWFLPVACAFSSFYDLPFLNGILAIIFHAFGAICICKMLDIKKNTTAFLIGALVTSFPAVTSVMMYNYVADGYSIAYFMSCLAAVFMTDKKPRYVLAACLIMLSSAIYQAYITVTIMLVILHLFDELVFAKKDAVYLIKKSLAYFVTGIAGMVLYYIILTVLLNATGTALLDYQGLNSTMGMSNIDILGSIYNAKETIIGYFFGDFENINVFVVINIIVFAITILAYIVYFIKNKIYLSPLKVILLVVFGVLLLFGGQILTFINAGIDYHNLMLKGYSVYYMFFIILYERGEDATKKRTAVKCWTVLALSLVMIFNYVVIANVSYHKAQMAYEKSYATLIRIADRIEQTENAEDCDEILVIGALENSEKYSVNLPPDITGITDGYIIRKDDETVGQSVLCSALNDYCQKDYKFVSGERRKSLLEKEEIKNMSLWPLKESIAVVDNIIVINLGVESE